MSEYVGAFDEDAPGIGHNSDPTFKALIRDGEELVRLEKRIGDLDDLLKVLRTRLHHMKTVTIPDKMSECGVADFQMEDGSRLQVGDFVSGSLPKDAEARDRALREIEAWGASGVIKNEITIRLDKGQHAKASKLVDQLRKKGFPVEMTSGIHPQTYLATIRERLKLGGSVDADLLGVFVGRTTKVTLPKGSPNGK